jgi:hypothetical protein
MHYARPKTSCINFSFTTDRELHRLIFIRDLIVLAISTFCVRIVLAP